MSNQAKKWHKYSDLAGQLGNELSINGARIKFIVLLITAFIKVQISSVYRKVLTIMLN